MITSEYKRILDPPGGSFFLLGPRGTGKSTWLSQRFPNVRTMTLLDERLYQSYLRDAGLFARELRAIPPKSTVVVDEIQRLPSLLNEVHRFIEERQLRFALTGSSARKLKQAGVNLLAGRAVRREMWPFLPEELGADFDLEAVLRWGSLPVIWTSEDKKDSLEAYVAMYLHTEIQAEALVRNLPGFARFLPVAALCHGQTVNISNLARDAQVARTTVSSYLEILEDTLIGYRLEAYQPRLRVRERVHPKFYFVDPGLVRACKGQLGVLVAEERGALLEGWVVSLLKAYQGYRKLDAELFYWAPTENANIEVDIVVRSGEDLVAIEVKAATRTRPEDLKGLRAFSAVKGVKRRILVNRVETRERTEDGIEVMPAVVFAKMVADGGLFGVGK